MNLKQYAEKHSQKALADLIGESPSFVNQWIRLDRPVPIPTCVLIEQRTGGAVTRQELRPKDWHAIWPELIEKQAA
jgi:DNA-binding transcriptional regulator YdaS (Cro superfamily)